MCVEREVKSTEQKYVCPMCDGTVSETPGECPKCGMALESEKPVHQQLGVPVTAGILVPFFGLTALLNPMIAAAAMSFSSVSVIGNALRLRRVSLK